MPRQASSRRQQAATPQAAISNEPPQHPAELALTRLLARLAARRAMADASPPAPTFKMARDGDGGRP